MDAALEALNSIDQKSIQNTKVLRTLPTLSSAFSTLYWC